MPGCFVYLFYYIPSSTIHKRIYKFAKNYKSQNIQANFNKNTEYKILPKPN